MKVLLGLKEDKETLVLELGDSMKHITILNEEFIKERLKSIIQLSARIEAIDDTNLIDIYINQSKRNSFLTEIKDIAEDLINYIEEVN